MCCLFQIFSNPSRMRKNLSLSMILSVSLPIIEYIVRFSVPSTDEINLSLIVICIFYSPDNHHYSSDIFYHIK